MTPNPTPEGTEPPETFISVDIETAGATPSTYSMLAVGACLVDDIETTFYLELKPESPKVDPQALSVTHLSIDVLDVMGTPPAEAMERFADWVDEVVPRGNRPVFVGFNAAFDWMFVADYFGRYLDGRNPFGYTALDIKSFAMGRLGSSWAATRMDRLAPTYLGGRSLSHHALADAQDQAELFRAIRDQPAPTTTPPPQEPS